MEKKRVWKYSELKEGQSFLGRIEGAQWESGQYGEQLHVEIEPLDHKVSGETGRYHEWFKYSDRKSSKWGALVKALEELGAGIESEEELAGRTFIWERRDVEFGNGNFTARDVLLPVEPTPEEKEERTTEKHHDFAELKELLAKDGMTSTQIERWARRQGIPKIELNRFMRSLDEAGVLMKGEDGTYFLK